MHPRSPLRITIFLHDDGVTAEARRGTRLVGLGVAVNDGRGPDETTRRAIQDLRDHVRARRLGDPVR